MKKENEAEWKYRAHIFIFILYDVHEILLFQIYAFNKKLKF